MRILATAVEEAVRAALQAIGWFAEPVVLEVPSEGQDPLLGEDRDATHVAGIAIALIPRDDLGDVDEYLLKPGPDGMVEAVDVDQDLRQLRQGRVADLVWESLAVRLGVSVERLLEYED